MGHDEATYTGGVRDAVLRSQHDAEAGASPHHEWCGMQEPTDAAAFKLQSGSTDHKEPGGWFACYRLGSSVLLLVALLAAACASERTQPDGDHRSADSC